MPLRPSSLYRVAVLLATLAGQGAPARAQTPRVAPEFYATVFVAGFERPLEVRQSGLKRRVDVASGAVVQSFITDRTRGALIVMTAAGRRRLAFVFPLAAEEANAPVPLDLSALQGARLNRIGGSSVAGRPCGLWRYTGYLGRNGVVCATDDGLVLQLTPDGRSSPLMQVLTLTQARQDPSWFRPPPDYQLAVVPGAGGIAAAVPVAPAASPTVVQPR
jgi:hypothetical protein